MVAGRFGVVARVFWLLGHCKLVARMFYVDAMVFQGFSCLLPGHQFNLIFLVTIY